MRDIHQAKARRKCRAMRLSRGDKAVECGTLRQLCLVQRNKKQLAAFRSALILTTKFISKMREFCFHLSSFFISVHGFSLRLHKIFEVQFTWSKVPKAQQYSTQFQYIIGTVILPVCAALLCATLFEISNVSLYLVLLLNIRTFIPLYVVVLCFPCE